MEVEKFIIYYWIVSWRNQSPHCFLKTNFNAILQSPPMFRKQSPPFGIYGKILHAFHISHMRPKCPVDPIVPDLIIDIIYDTE
jgi:hypothetical protein